MAASPVKFGNSTILVEDEDFADGFSSGFGDYPQDDQPLTVEAIHRLITDNLTDHSEPMAWNLGFILGALTGYYVGPPAYEEVAEVSQVQLGSLTLHLNRWRFRDGYHVGQREYQAQQAQRTDPLELTARELLDFVAHRDPATQTYHFDHDELTGLEDTLGQLIGYLCAALFPKTEEALVLEPLVVVTSQEA